MDLHQWMPPHAGATGLAILAYLPEENRHRYACRSRAHFGMSERQAALLTAGVGAQIALIRMRRTVEARGEGSVPGGSGAAGGDAAVAFSDQTYAAGQIPITANADPATWRWHRWTRCRSGG